MPTNEPTWTEQRIELLKSRFQAGLTAREIAAEIGVSRNAVIGKLSRLDLRRETVEPCIGRAARGAGLPGDLVARYRRGRPGGAGQRSA